MRNEFIIKQLRERILTTVKYPDHNVVHDAIENLERYDLATLLMNHLMENGYIFFYMSGKFHLTNPLEDSIHYESDSVVEMLEILIVQTLIDDGDIT